MAEEQQNHTEPLVPCIWRQLWRLCWTSRALQCPPEHCHRLLGAATGAEHSTEQPALRKGTLGTSNLELGSLKPPVSELCSALVRKARRWHWGVCPAQLQLPCRCSSVSEHSCSPTSLCRVPLAAACFNYSQTLLPPSGCAHNSAKGQGAVWEGILFPVKFCKN